jgi:AraC family transcriptional regulator
MRRARSDIAQQDWMAVRLVGLTCPFGRCILETIRDFPGGNIMSVNAISTRGAESKQSVKVHQSLTAVLNAFDAGVTTTDGLPYTLINMYLGPSIEVSCTRAGRVRRGREVAGDLDILPAHTPCAWETSHGGLLLMMRVPDALLRRVAGELGMDPQHIELADRFQMRDPQIEHIGWALKADLEAGSPGGALYRESLGTALATRLLQRHHRRSLPMREMKGSMSSARLKQLVAYIEDNIESDLSLAEIAAIASLSVSHLKTLFRQSAGISVHQYVLRRRVERAKVLLRDRSLTIAQVALATGFAHQSHMARHMRRILGMTPAVARKQAELAPLSS